MSTHISDILEVLEGIAPFKLAEVWDNVGLLVGDPGREVGGVLVGLDPTVALVDEAISLGADAIVTHHPVIFHPLTAVNTADPAGRLLEKALAGRISIIACHTNLDSARNGVSDVLADHLGLEQVVPLVPNEVLHGTGIGRVGDFSEDLGGETFMDRVFDTLGISAVQVAGRLPETVRRVAVCGGSGSDLAEAAWNSGADVYLSAEIKHSIARWAQECGFCIIDGTHYATEQPVVAALAARLELAAKDHNWGVPIHQTRTQLHPFTLKNRVL